MVFFCEETHEFHFIMDREMVQKLLSVKFVEVYGSLAKAIRLILQRFYPLLENWHYTGGDRRSRYGFIHSDRQIPRCSMHIELPYGLYKRLKLMHQDLNMYSIAQLVRRVLEMFLRFVKEYGDEWEEQLTTILGKIRSQNSKVTRVGKKKFRQLLDFIDYKGPQLEILTFYNQFFLPQLFLRC